MRNKDRSEGKEEAKATSASSSPAVRGEPELPAQALFTSRIHLDSSSRTCKPLQECNIQLWNIHTSSPYIASIRHVYQTDVHLTKPKYCLKARLGKTAFQMPNFTFKSCIVLVSILAAPPPHCFPSSASVGHTLSTCWPSLSAPAKTLRVCPDWLCPH